MITKTISLTQTTQWLGNYTKPYSKWVILSACSALILVGFNILRAGLVASLVENALEGNIAALTQLVAIIIPGTIIAMLATWASSYGASRAGTLAVRDLKNILVSHVTRARILRIERFQAGDLLTRLNKDVAMINGFIAGQFPNMLFQPLMFLCSSIYLLSINWKLFSACYILLPFTFKIAIALNKRGAGFAREYHQGLDNANSLVKQCMDGIVTVKTYNLENHLLQKCRKSFDNVLSGLMKKELCDSISLPFYFLTSESPRIICVLVGGYLTINGEMTIGELVAATQLVGYVSAPAFALMRLLNGTRQAGVAVGRLSEILDIEMEPTDNTQLTVINDFPAVWCKDVSYSYESGARVLQDLTLTVPVRGLTALVGASGGGKTTFMSLLSGFYQPQDGQVSIFGHDVAQVPPSSLRNLVSYVPQDSLLFPGSIMDNIRMGNPEASEELILQAAKASHVDKFASTLPQGLNTLLDEGGRGLSGGQRQRVAIARAALKQAPLLILDEPTSALDPVSEELINQTLQELAMTSAVMVVSHRLSTIRRAQNIIVIEDGTVVEQGSYQELVTGGVFARLFDAQIAAAEVRYA